jgi:hypothetical protein
LWSVGSSLDAGEDAYQQQSIPVSTFESSITKTHLWKNKIMLSDEMCEMSNIEKVAARQKGRLEIELERTYERCWQRMATDRQTNANKRLHPNTL